MITLSELVLRIENNEDAALLFDTVKAMNECALEPVEMKFSCDMRTVAVSGTRVMLYKLCDMLYMQQLRVKLASSPTLREQFQLEGGGVSS